EASDVAAVREVRLVGRPLALKDRHALDGPPIGRPRDGTFAGKLFEGDAGDDVGELAEPVFLERHRAIGRPAGGQHDRAHRRRLDTAVSFDVRFEATWLAGDLLDLGAGQDLDVRPRFDLPNEVVDP